METACTSAIEMRSHRVERAGPHLLFSNWDSDGMLWQLRMGDRKGGDGSVLGRLRPELFLPLLRLPADTEGSTDAGVSCTNPGHSMAC